MSQRIINIGTSPGAGDGDELWVAFDKTNQNFTEVYSTLSNISSPVLSVAGRTGNIVLTVNDIIGIESLVTSNVTISYNSLTDKPTLFSGNYNDLVNKPLLFSGSYDDLTNKPTLFSGSYDDLTNKPTLFSGNYNDLTNKPVIPTSSSQLTNDSGYLTSANALTLFSAANGINYDSSTGVISVNTNIIATQSYVGTQISNLVNSTPATLDTLKELADAIGADPNFSTTITTSLGNRLRIDAPQALSSAQQEQGRSNLGLSSVAASGNYTELINKPVLANVAITGNYNDLTNKPVLFSGNYADLSNKPALANVATTGSYNDLSNKPALANIAISGSYNDLLNKPLLFSGDYADLANQPVLSNVAITGSYADLLNTPTLFSGSYEDLTNKPVLFSGNYADLSNKPALANVATTGSYNDLSNTPEFANVAISGSYNDLVNTPLIPAVPANISAFTNDSGYLTTTTARNSFSAGTGIIYDSNVGIISVDTTTVATQSYVGAQISNLVNSAPVALDTLKELADAIGSDANFATTITTALGNRLRVDAPQMLSNTQQNYGRNNLGLANVATSGSYDDLLNKPVLANIAISGSYTDLTNKPDLFSGSYDDLLNKPVLANIAISGSYTDLTNKPDLFSGSYGDLTNRPVFAQVAISGSYADLINTPTLFSGSYTDLSNTPVLANIATSGSYADLINTPILANVAISGSYNDLVNTPLIPAVPANISAFTNDSGYLTTTTARNSFSAGTGIIYDSNVGIISVDTTTVATQLYVNTQIDNLINNAPAALDTLKELADAIGSDANFASTVTTSLSNRLRVDAPQTLSNIQQLQGRNNLGLAAVAATGSYGDLTDTPILSNVSVSGDYNDLLNKPTLFSGSYTDLTNKPTLFSGSYTDLTNKPTLFSGSYTDLTNKPTLFSGSYTDLTNKPTFSNVATSGQYSDLSGAPVLANVATSGSYTDLTNKPVLFSGNYTDLTNKPALANVATSGNYADLSGTPVLANVATSGSYDDLIDKPTITISGDASGSGTTAITLTLANTTVTAGTYRSVTVDAKGRVTAGTNPTTISGYGITDAYTKTEVDSLVTGLDMKQSVRVATTANITLSGTQTIDGVAVVAGDRVLVKDQTTGSQNGIYVVAASAWTRAIDADNTPGSEVTAGMYVFVVEGTTNADTGWVLVTNDTITLGTTALTFTQFNGLGQVTAGSGLTKTGNQIDAVGTANRITVNADSIDIASTYVGQTSITTLGNITTGTWSASPIGTAYGGTGLGSFTANGVVYASSSSTLTTGNVLVFNGTSLGIGTAPVQRLTVAGDGRFSAGSNYASLTVLRTDQSGAGNTDIALVDVVTGSGWARFGAMASDGAAVGGNMQFFRDGSTRILNASTEYMRFNPSGEAGIGVSPLSGIKLAVGTATGSVYQRLVTGSDNDVGLQVVNSTCTTAFGADSIGGYVITQTAGKPFVFYTGGVNERMRITGGGNVGIGTTNPSQKLSVSGGSIQLDNAQYIRGKTATGTETRMLGINSSDVLYIGSVDAAVTGVTFNANGTTYADFNSSGMFTAYKATGIGSAALSYAQLAVQGTPTSVATILYGVVSDVSFPSTANATVQAYFGRVSTAASTYTVTNAIGLQAVDAIKGAGSTITNNYGVFVGELTQGTNNYGIRTGVSSGANKWNIYASGTASNYFAGNVGIGTTSPSVALDVNGGINATSISSSTKFATTSLTTPLVIGGTGTTSTLTLRSTSGVGATGADIIFQTGNNGATEAMRVLNNGRVGVGTNAPSALFHISSGDATQIIENTAANSNATLQLKYPSRTWSIATRGADLSGALVIRDATATTDRLMIDANGNVSVGTTTPLASTRLHIEQNSNSNYSTSFAPGTTKSQLVLRDISDVTTYTNPFAAVQFGAGTTGAGWSYVAGAREGAGTSFLAFGTGTGGQATERMRINSSGNVFISNGTTTGMSKSLNIYDAAEASILLSSDTTGSGSIGWRDQGASTNWGGIAGTNNSGANPYITFSNNGEKMRLDAQGRVLIGATTARTSYLVTPLLQTEGLAANASGASFTLNSANSEGANVFFTKTRGTSAGSNTTVVTGDTLGNLYWAAADGTNTQSVAARISAAVEGTVGTAATPGVLRFATTGAGSNFPTERMRIDSSGNVGVGIASPTARLHALAVSAGASLPLLVLNNSSSADGTGTSIDMSSDGSAVVTGRIAAVRDSAGVHSLRFSTFGGGLLSERMRIDSSGNVGIGTTSPSYKLDVSGNARITSNLTIGSMSLDGIALSDTSTLTTSATTANQVLNTFASATYRTAKYLIQVTSGTSYQAAEIILTHDGTTPTLVQYADIATGATLATFDADISGGNVRLLTTPTNAVTTYKLVRTIIVV